MKDGAVTPMLGYPEEGEDPDPDWLPAFVFETTPRQDHKQYMEEMGLAVMNEMAQTTKRMARPEASDSRKE